MNTARTFILRRAASGLMHQRCDCVRLQFLLSLLLLESIPRVQGALMVF